MHYIIAGAGPSGVIACETIRKMANDARITLISGQQEAPYSRMAIPYFLEEKITESGTHLRHTENYFSDLNIDIVQQPLTQVDSNKKRIILADGTQLNYDKLLLATGAKAISPPVPGIDCTNVHNCWTLEDARNIAAKALPGSSMVLMGAGFIGCIILQSLLKRGVTLTVVEMGDRMVPRMMDDTAGALLKSWCEAKGVRILTSQQVTAISENNHSLNIELKDGETLTADLLISATGVRSNTAYLEGSAIHTDQGILVNEFLQTNIDTIYAAGDVAQGLDFSTQAQQVQAIQPTAVEHGRIAAINMVSSNKTSHKGSLNMNILDTMGLVSTSFGQWQGVDDSEQSVLLDKDNYRYLNLQFKDDCLVGISSLGHTQHIGVARGLIRGKVKLGIWKQRLMDNPTLLMDAYLSTSLSQA